MAQSHRAKVSRGIQSRGLQYLYRAGVAGRVKRQLALIGFQPAIVGCEAVENSRWTASIALLGICDGKIDGGAIGCQSVNAVDSSRDERLNQLGPAGCRPLFEGK
jgi:hypothetical protein